MKFLEPFAFGVLMLTCSFISPGVAQARTLNSSMYFEGNYNGRKIYGVLNDWDGRACTILDNKITIGIVTKVGREEIMRLSRNREVTITNTFLLNPVGSGQIPSSWRNKPQFDRCYKEMSLAECFLPSGTKYYSPENEVFRNITRSRLPVFALGTLTNTFDRDDGTKDLEWATFGFTKQSNSTEFIVNYRDLQCRNKL
jgi:hypothetical protein